VSVSYQIARSRFIREIVLDQLLSLHENLPGVPLDARHIYRFFDGGRTQFTRPEIDAQVADLVDHGLAAVLREPCDGAPEKLSYLSTARGRNFCQAGKPWDKIDEFTGGYR